MFLDFKQQTLSSGHVISLKSPIKRSLYRSPDLSYVISLKKKDKGKKAHFKQCCLFPFPSIATSGSLILWYTILIGKRGVLLSAQVSGRGKLCSNVSSDPWKVWKGNFKIIMMTVQCCSFTSCPFSFWSKLVLCFTSSHVLQHHSSISPSSYFSVPCVELVPLFSSIYHSLILFTSWNWCDHLHFIFAISSSKSLQPNPHQKRK